MATAWNKRLQTAWDELVRIWRPVAGLRKPPFLAPADACLPRQAFKGASWRSRIPATDAAAMRFLEQYDQESVALDQIPEPFIGRPWHTKGGRKRAATVVILNINPGLSFWSQSNGRYVRAIRRNLRGEGLFYPLQPSLRASGGGGWWADNKLSAVANAIADEQNCSREEAFRWMAYKAPLFCCEWLGYHSGRMPKNKQLEDLPSTRAACRMVQALAKTGALFVVLVGTVSKAEDRFGVTLKRDLVVGAGAGSAKRQTQGWKPLGKVANNIAKALLS